MEDNLQKLITLLSDASPHRVTEIARIMETTNRTVYRALHTLESKGFVIERNRGRPYIAEESPDYTRKYFLENLSVPECLMLYHSVLKGDMNDPIRLQLISKLEVMIQHSSGGPQLYSDTGISDSLNSVLSAIANEKQIILKGYASGSSNTASDRLVEPIMFSANYRQFFAFDVEKMKMRCFKPTRAKDIVVTDNPWKHKKKHKVPLMDCFWMTGNKTFDVVLHLDHLALGLLHEEHPLSWNYKVKKYNEPKFPYTVILPICSPEGVGRFVMGLPGHCVVEKGKELIDWIENNKSTILYCV